MSWRYKIDLTDLYKSYQDNSITVEKLTEQISYRFQREALSHKEDQNDLLEFSSEVFVIDNIEDFDVFMVDVFDWADKKKVWVATF